MHIGFIEDTLLRGGTQIWVTEAAHYFLTRGEDVTVLTPENGWVAEECAAIGANVVTYNYEDADASSWETALRDCDVAVCTVHPPRDDFHCSVFAAECIKNGGLKTILITKTGTIVPSYKREFYLPDERIQSYVISIADFTRRYLLGSYKLPSEKVELIYQGVDINNFLTDLARKERAFEKYPLPEQTAPIIGNVGSLENRKGQSVLLEAFADVVGTMPDAHLMFVGEGPDEAMLRGKVVELGLQRSVSFFPFTRDPATIYQLLDMLVLPSLHKEGLPNVLLESLAMGVPVLASDIAGVPEVVKDGETGYLVEPGNRKQLASSMIKLWYDQDNYGRMQKNGRELIAERFDKQKQFDLFLDYFYDIVT